MGSQEGEGEGSKGAKSKREGRMGGKAAEKTFCFGGNFYLFIYFFYRDFLFCHKYSFLETKEGLVV